MMINSGCLAVPVRHGSQMKRTPAPPPPPGVAADLLRPAPQSQSGQGGQLSDASTEHGHGLSLRSVGITQCHY